MDSMDQGGIKWGAEIAVDGVRPEWLPVDDTQVWYRCLDGYTCTHRAFMISNDLSWWTKVGHADQIVAIRLPAGHPHYQKQAAQAATPAIDPALVERMIAVLRIEATGAWDTRIVQEARDILKALEPVGPDEEEARRAVAEDKWANAYDLALAAIRRGRQLERGEK